MAATLRPETMAGQTNCWILPEGEYGAYKGLNNEIFILTARSARNLAYQDKLPQQGQAELLLSLQGQDLIGVPLKVELPIPCMFLTGCQCLKHVPGAPDAVVEAWEANPKHLSWVHRPSQGRSKKMFENISETLLYLSVLAGVCSQKKVDVCSNTLNPVRDSDTRLFIFCNSLGSGPVPCMT